jgi:hypothetical protein
VIELAIIELAKCACIKFVSGNWEDEKIMESADIPGGSHHHHPYHIQEPARVRVTAIIPGTTARSKSNTGGRSREDPVGGAALVYRR